MSEAKPKRWSHRFELAPEVEDHTRLHKHLEQLKKIDGGSDWIRDTLIAALPAKTKKGIAVIHAPFRNPIVTVEEDDEQLHYEDVHDN